MLCAVLSNSARLTRRDDAAQGSGGTAGLQSVGYCGKVALTGLRAGAPSRASLLLVSVLKKLIFKLVKEIAEIGSMHGSPHPGIDSRIPGAISCIQLLSSRAPERRGRERLPAA